MSIAVADVAAGRALIHDVGVGACGDFAWRLDENILDAGWLLEPLDDWPSRLIAWSGNLGDSLDDRHPHTWMQPGHEALGAACDAVVDQLRDSGRTLCFQPHARHVLSDPQSAVNFARAREEEPFDLVIGTASMLEPSMLGEIEDHLTRIFATLGDHCVAVVIADAAVDEASDRLRQVPLGEGVLPGAVVGRLLQGLVAAEIPLLVRPDDAARVGGWLGG